MREVTAKWCYSEDYLRTFWKEFLRHKAKSRHWTIPSGVLLIASGGLMLLLFDRPLGSSLIPWMLVAFGAAQIAWHFLDKSRWFRAMRTARQMDGEVTLRFTSEGIDHAGPTAQGKMTWHAIVSVSRTEHGLFLSQGLGLHIYVPFSSLANPSDASIIEELHRSAA